MSKESSYRVELHILPTVFTKLDKPVTRLEKCPKTGILSNKTYSEEEQELDQSMIKFNKWPIEEKLVDEAIKHLVDHVKHTMRQKGILK